MLSPTRITLENNEKKRPQPDRENAFAGASGGGVRRMRTSLCKDRYIIFYTEQGPRHSASAAVWRAKFVSQKPNRFIAVLDPASMQRAFGITK